MESDHRSDPRPDAGDVGPESAGRDVAEVEANAAEAPATKTPAARADRTTLPPAQFNKLLTESLPHMRAFARSLTEDRALADDLTQEAATRALANRDGYHAGTNFRAWVFTIVRNCFYSEFRRKWRRVEKSNDEALVRAGAPETQESGLYLEDFKRAFTQLSEEQRESLVLVGACGFDYAQAAEIVGCAVGTMKSRVSRGRAELRSLLDDDAVTADRAAFAELAKGGFEERLDRSLGLK